MVYIDESLWPFKKNTPGYAGLLNRYNLTTNGTFRIHQRSHSQVGQPGTWIPINTGATKEFIADAWYLSSPAKSTTTVDYLEYKWFENEGYIGFAGYGQKGQFFEISSQDVLPFGYQMWSYGNTNTRYRTPITSAVECMAGDRNRVALEVECNPRYRTGYSKRYSKLANLSNSKKCSEAVCIYHTITKLNDTGMNPAKFKVTLKETGEFEFFVYNFRELAGGYQNPPSECMIPYNEEIGRCERFYQTGHLLGAYPIWLPTAGSPMTTTTWIQFRTLMSQISTVIPSNMQGVIYEAPPLGRDGATSNGWTPGGGSGGSLSHTHLTTSSCDGCQISWIKTLTVPNATTVVLSFDWKADISI